ncbi:MAG: hypothetical protein WDW38_006280 [Sanguina aurantia]
MQDSLDNAECCWICLEGSGELVRPCRCPRKAHRPCLARWQLHCAGKLEEKKCRFCKESLPDWRQWLGTSSSSAPQQPPTLRQLTGPPNARPGGHHQRDRRAADGGGGSSSHETLAVIVPVPAPPAFMRISYGGESYKIRVRSGTEGMQQFVLDCRKLLNIPPDQPFDVHFHCKEPTTGSDLRFHGIEAYDAAVHCASVAAPRPAIHTPSSSPSSPTSITNHSSSSSSARSTPTASRQPSQTSGPQVQRSSAPSQPESAILRSPFAAAAASSSPGTSVPATPAPGNAAVSGPAAATAADASATPSRPSADRGTGGSSIEPGSGLALSGSQAGFQAAAVERWVSAPPAGLDSLTSVSNRIRRVTRDLDWDAHDINHSTQARGTRSEAGDTAPAGTGIQTQAGNRIQMRDDQEDAGTRIHTQAGNQIQGNQIQDAQGDSPANACSLAEAERGSSLRSLLPTLDSSRSSGSSLASPQSSSPQSTSPQSMTDATGTPRGSLGSSGGYSAPGDACHWPWHSSSAGAGRVEFAESGDRGESLRGGGGSGRSAAPMPAMHAPSQSGLMDRLVGMVKRYRSGGGGH